MQGIMPISLRKEVVFLNIREAAQETYIMNEPFFLL